MTIMGRKIQAMIDSGAQGNFISPNLINKLRLPWKMKDEPYRLTTVEGHAVKYGQGVVDTEVAQLQVDIQGTKHSVTLDVTEISKHDVILGIPWLRASNPRVNWRTGQLQWDLPGCDYDNESGSRRAPQSNQDRPLGIYVIAREPKASTTEIPEEYSKYSKLFSGELETGLPEHSQWDHEIKLQPGTEPTFNKIYPQNPAQDKALKEYLEESLRLGHIRPSESPAGHPILWVPKKNGKLRPCIDYRSINKITIKNRYPLPLISEIRDKLGQAKWFTTLDLKGAYNLIRMAKGHEWKTAFRTTRGHFEYLVMPFGLTNAPATFQTMIDNVLRKQLDKFAVVYLDDILIYSNTLEEHRKHVHEVLQTLQDNKLLVEGSKSKFHQHKVEFLGYEITPGQINMSPSKIEDVRSWPEPTNVREVRGFLGFANFYRKFIRKFGEITIPLTNLTKKDNEFKWTEKEAKAFETLKEKILEEPVLLTADPEKPFEVETDASDYAIGGQLGQRDKEGRLHPVAFLSKKLNGPELNYGIHDKELMAIIQAFKEWRHYLVGANHKVTVYSDHKNLTSFTTTKELNKRQIRWYETLTDYDFEILYRKGSLNGRADALSRREDLKSTEASVEHPMLKYNKDGNLVLSTREINMTWQVQPDDIWLRRIKSRIQGDRLTDTWRSTPFLTRKENDYFYNDRLYVPAVLQRQLVEEIHAHPLHGHQGVAKTISRLRRSYDFPESRKIVQEIIKKCDICNKAKIARHAPYGELQPIPPPERAWQTVTMDFIVKLPKSKEPMTGVFYDSILVIVDKLTKYAYYIPYMESSNTKDLAYMFFKTVIAQHGLPTKLISDRDKLFTSNFWKCLMETMKIKQGLSTAFHPQSDGQTEILNQVLEQYLRSYVNHQQDDWVEWLPLAQWAYNSSEIDNMKMSPFRANYGFDPVIETHATRNVNAPAATAHAATITEIQKQLQQEWIFLQNRMKHYADKKRLPAPILEEGHKVYLIRKNIKTKRPSDKLDWKKIGPFLIKRKISNTNYELSLPDGMKIHPIFHISLLEKAPDDITVTTDIVVENNDEYEIEKILKARGSIKKREYLIKWKGYPNSENTWEPAKNLTSCLDLLRGFHQQSARGPAQGSHPDRTATSQAR